MLNATIYGQGISSKPMATNTKYQLSFFGGEPVHKTHHFLHHTPAKQCVLVALKAKKKNETQDGTGPGSVPRFLPRVSSAGDDTCYSQCFF